MQLIIVGLASKNKWIFTVKEDQLNSTLLSFLRKNQLPIASSCDGEGICEKCVINTNILSCKLLVKDFINKYNSYIEITYL